MRKEVDKDKNKLPKVDAKNSESEPIKDEEGSAIEVDDMTKATQIQLISNSNAAQGGDVPTKIQLVITDNFGYEVTKTIDVPFIMTFQQ